MRIIILICIIMWIENFLPVQYTSEYNEQLAVWSAYSYETYDAFIWSMSSFETSNGTMYYHDHWPKNWETIVLLHGTPTNSWLYRNMIQPLVDKGYRIIAPDMIWFGVSEKNWSIDAYTTDNQVQSLLELLDMLGVDTFFVWGHDQWSLWVWNLLQEHNERISWTIIFNALAVLDGFKHPWLFGNDTMLMKVVRGVMWSKILVRPIMYVTLKWSTTDSSMITGETLSWYIHPLQAWMNKTYHHFITWFDRVYEEISAFEKARPTITTPSLILRWMDDPILDGNIQIPTLENTCVSCEVHELDANHFLQEEIPDTLVTLIATFVEWVSQ